MPTYKQQLRRNIMKISIALVAFYVANIVFAGIIEVVFLISGIDFAQITMDAAESGAVNYDRIYSSVMESMQHIDTSFAGIASIVGIIAGAIVLFLVIRGSLSLKGIFNSNGKMDFATFAKLLVCIMGMQIVMSALLWIFTPLLDKLGASLTDMMEQSTSLLMNPAGILYIAIIGPIFEELIFRGAIMRSLEKYGANFAIVLSSLLFGVYHLIIFQVVFAFFVGLMLAYAAGRFSIKWSILLHILSNSIACVSMINDQAAAVVNIIFCVAFLASITIVITNRGLIAAQRSAGFPASIASIEGASDTSSTSSRMGSDNHETRTLESQMPSNSDITEPHPFKITFTSPFLIGVLVLALAIGLWTMWL
jgi:membrane protease YdiL (CAAX protease family)